MKKKKIPLYKVPPDKEVWIKVRVTDSMNGTFVCCYTFDTDGHKRLASIHGLTEVEIK